MSWFSSRTGAAIWRPVSEKFRSSIGVLLFFREHEPEGECQHDAAVAGVAEHDGEQEGEGGDGEDGRVDLQHPEQIS